MPVKLRHAASGRERHLSSPHDAIASGVVTIPQELQLVPALSIAENLALGDLPTRRAVLDALAPLGVGDIKMPLTTEAVWGAIAAARNSRVA